MVYVLVGDGECNEGSVWEAFMAAGHYRLDNLVFVIDYNKVQAKGFFSQDMSIEPLADKLRAFNLDVFEAQNGHDVAELVDCSTAPRTSAAASRIAVILNTIKGKKVGECQYNPTGTPRRRATRSGREWLMELWERDGRRLGIPEGVPAALGRGHRDRPARARQSRSHVGRQA